VATKRDEPHLRDRILAASVALVQESGIGALSMREVARRAGVSHQAPYHHFADKEAILAALAEAGFRRLADALEAAPGADALEALTHGGQAYLQFALEHPAHFRVMFRPELVELERYPTAQVEAERAYAALETLVGRVVAEGKMPPEGAPGLLVLAWSFVHGLAALVLDGPLRHDESQEAAVAGAFKAFEDLVTRATGGRRKRG
jgi:AcrR family transcriptional regulator